MTAEGKIKVRKFQLLILLLGHRGAEKLRADGTALGKTAARVFDTK